MPEKTDRADRMEKVCRIVDESNLTRFEKLFNCMVPEEHLEEFKRSRVEIIVTKYPEKFGYIFEVPKGLKELKKIAEIEEMERLEKDE